MVPVSVDVLLVVLSVGASGRAAWDRIVAVVRLSNADSPTRVFATATAMPLAEDTIAYAIKRGWGPTSRRLGVLVCRRECRARPGWAAGWSARAIDRKGIRRENRGTSQTAGNATQPEVAAWAVRRGGRRAERKRGCRPSPRMRGAG